MDSLGYYDREPCLHAELLKYAEDPDGLESIFFLIDWKHKKIPEAA